MYFRYKWGASVARTPNPPTTPAVASPAPTAGDINPAATRYGAPAQAPLAAPTVCLAVSPQSFMSPEFQAFLPDAMAC